LLLPLSAGFSLKKNIKKIAVHEYRRNCPIRCGIPVCLGRNERRPAGLRGDKKPENSGFIPREESFVFVHFRKCGIFYMFCGMGGRPESGGKNVQILNIAWTDAVYYLTWI
jgi:hypothetical protein